MLLDTFLPSQDSLIRMRNMHDSKRRDAHWFPWLMLVWTFWIFATPMFDDGQSFPNWLRPTLASFVVFLVLFYRAYYRERAHVVWCALGIAALGFVVTPFNAGAQGYLIYSCAFLAFCGRPREALSNIVLVLLLYSLEWWLLGFPWLYLGSAILVGLAVGFMNINFLIKYQRDAALKLSHDEVRRLAALAERERIGRDLHDLLGHTLSLITLKSELAARLLERDVVAARREMADVECVARDALAQVRRAVTGIRAAGLAAELASAKLLLESNSVRLQYSMADVELPPDIETTLAMTVREAVTNIQRHARALSASITLQVIEEKLILCIHDNGRGGAIAPGNGLTGMRERLASVNAELRVESLRGRGTTLTVTLLLSHAAVHQTTATASLRHAYLS